MGFIVDLLWLSGGVPAPVWPVGKVRLVESSISSSAASLGEQSYSSQADAVLFWDGSLGAPNRGLVQELVGSPVDCWHAGLRLGMGGLPGILDFISPTWMLACDPHCDVEATSWRLSLRACLVRSDVLRKLGGPRPEFETLAAAALEMGHRWIRRGALMRHVPGLVEDGNSPIPHPPSPIHFPFSDEVRFAYYRSGRKWAAWAVFRAVMTRYVSLSSALRAWREVMSTPRPAEPPPLRSSDVSSMRSVVCGQSPGFRSQRSGVRSVPASNHVAPLTGGPAVPAVSVLIPTVDRYPYLGVLLEQLRQQTIPPLEIIIVDQTERERRQDKLAAEFADLPLQVIFQDEPGQCTSRNVGLQIARGDYILFIDDDDEVQPDLIEKHLRNLAHFHAEVSSGVADEVGAGALPPDFCFLRASDVFPTNNTMIRRDVLLRSGLFDLAYDRRQRADGDLGMRVFLAGAIMILNPAISVLHHHAPSGGLRKHKARTMTYAASRSSLFSRAVASASEFYLAGRYFPPAHAREMFWKSVLGTFSIHGRFGKRLAKVVVSTVFLPQSVARLRERTRQAAEMATEFPQIPRLDRALPNTDR